MKKPGNRLKTKKFCNNTKENFPSESEKRNVKFYKNSENTGKILKICNVIL